MGAKLNNPKWMLTPILVIFSTLTLSACSDSITSYDIPNPMTVKSSWSPNSVTYACSNPTQCPDNQGVLLGVTVTETNDGYYTHVSTQVYRCTGSIYSATKIISAGHCAEMMKNSDHIYFRTVEKPGRPSHTLTVKSTPVVKIFSAVESPDFAVFELASPIHDVQFAHPAPSNPADVTHLTALVANGRVQNTMTDFVLDAVDCRTDINLINPVAISSNPAVFNVMDCVLVSGNSGGALVDPKDLTSVYGILSYSNNESKKEDANSKLASLLRDMQAVHKGADTTKKIDIGGFSNARCVGFPDWPRLESNCFEMSSEKIAALRRPYLGRQVQDWLVSKSTDWLNSSKSLYVSGGRIVRLVPALTAIKSRYSDLDDKEHAKSIAMLPLPVCIDRPSTEDNFLISMPIDLYKSTTNESGVDIRPLERSAFVTISLTRVGSKSYRASYIVSGSFSVMAEQNSSIEHMMNGDVIQLDTCKGDEVSSFLEALKSSAAE